MSDDAEPKAQEDEATAHARWAAVEAVAEAWASIDGRLDLFQCCKADAELEEVEGRYGGYMADAVALISRIEARGFVIRPAEAEPAS